jgi:DNA-directed RNA polymerase subunit RPC12/RpoP
MAIRFRCGCGREISLKDEYAGKKGKCPACGMVIRAPGAQPALPEKHPLDALQSAPSPKKADAALPNGGSAGPRSVGELENVLRYGRARPPLPEDDDDARPYELASPVPPAAGPAFASPQMVAFPCPRCGESIEVDSDMGGTTVACWNCSLAVTVPMRPNIGAPTFRQAVDLASGPMGRGIVAHPGRPTSVTVIAVLQIIGAVIGLLSVPYTLATLRGAIHVSEAHRLLLADPLWRQWLTVGMLSGTVLSILWIIVGVGLLRLRRGARTAALCLLALSIPMSLALVFIAVRVFWTGPFPPGVLEASQAAQGERFLFFCGMLGGAFGNLIYALILLAFLASRKVVHAFRASI